MSMKFLVETVCHNWKLPVQYFHTNCFKALEYRDQIPEFAGMFQKEVAERICEKKGTKAYGILSVLVQGFL